jgi:hypothetical protein
MIKIIKIFILLILSQSLSAKILFDYNNKIKNAKNALLNLDFESYNKIVKQTNNNMLVYWLSAYKIFVFYRTSPQTNNINNTVSQIKFYAEKIENNKKETPYFYYSLSDIYFFLSFLYLEKGETFKAFQNYFYARKYTKINLQKYPDFKLSGKHKLAIFTINNLISSELGLTSKSEKDICTEYLNLFSKYSKNIQHVDKREIKLLGVLLFDIQFSGNYKLLLQKTNINENFAKQGPLETYAMSVLYKKNENYNKQADILRFAVSNHFSERLNLLNLYYANTLLNNNNYSAGIYYKKFIDNQKNNRLMQYARFKYSMFCFLNNNKPAADSLAFLIKKTFLVKTFEDKQAVYEIKNYKNWNKELILSRVFFDGGNYQAALKVLLSAKNNVHNYNKYQKLEYSYRLARIYDKTNKYNLAVKFYDMVINSKLDSKFYYPAYAAYYAGKIELSLKNYNKAKKYFKYCIKLDSPVYKSDIHKKAENAITQI